jgi:hypothetical protein
MAYLLPYFFDYYCGVKNSGIGAWPDGRGRYFQPLKLVQAFDILTDVMYEKEKKDMEK